MNHSKMIAAAGIFVVTLLGSQGLDLQAQTNKDTIKITDSKLHSLNFGIDSIDHWIGKAKPGDTKRAAALFGDLEKLETRFRRLPVNDTDQYLYVANRLKESRLAIEKISSAAVGGESDHSKPQLEQDHQRSNPEWINLARTLSNLQLDIDRYKDNQRQRSRMRSDLETIKKRFDRLPVSNHPDYVGLKKQIGIVESALQPSGIALQVDDKQVAAYVESVRLRYSEEILLPEARDIMRNGELTSSDVDGIVSKLKKFREKAEDDLPTLRQVVEATGQGEYWLKWLEKGSTEKLKRNMTSIKAAIQTAVNSGLRNAKQRSELDSEKNKYAFTNESVRKSHEADHDRTLRTLRQAARLEQLLELPATWSPKIDELQGYVSAYKAKAAAATTVRELPAEVGAGEHHRIANAVLKNKKYGVGTVVHTVVNSKPVPRDRIEHVATGNKLETVVRKWKEYQVTTVETEGGRFYVYVNNLANFSRAPGTTPLNQWILKQRFKRGEISQQDLDAVRTQK